MGRITKEIKIPTDIDGFVLLQCPKCGNFFKLRPSEMEADDVIQIYCPFCGLKSDNYYTDDIFDLANIMGKNIANDIIAKELKKIENQFKNSSISFKVDSKPDEEAEVPIVSKIDSMQIEKYKCCKKEAKIHPLDKLSGSYCPYCGVRYDGDK